MLNIADRQYNRAIQREKDERSFPLRAKLMIGGSIVVGFLAALLLFIMTIRGSEEIVRQVNHY